MQLIDGIDGQWGREKLSGKKNEVRVWERAHYLYLWRKQDAASRKHVTKSGHPYWGHKLCPNLHRKDACAEVDEIKSNAVVTCIRLQVPHFFPIQPFLLSICLTPSPISTIQPTRAEG